MNALWDAPWITSIVDLCLDNAGLDDAGVQKMTQRLQPGNLAFLSLAKNHISDQGAEALLNWQGLSQLVDLSLYGTQITPAMKESIMKIVQNG